jgi:hypothetical protein
MTSNGFPGVKAEAFLFKLRSRELGLRRASPFRSYLTSPTASLQKKIESRYEIKIITLINSLNEAITMKNYTEIEYALDKLLSNLVLMDDEQDDDDIIETPNNSRGNGNNRRQANQRNNSASSVEDEEDLFAALRGRRINQNKALQQWQKELFLLYNGHLSLLRFFTTPFLPSLSATQDARNLSKEYVTQQSSLWNKLFLLLKELIISFPFLGISLLFRNSIEIKFFFTLLSHSSIYDNVLLFLEELLILRDDTFSLASIPSFFSLVRSFSSKQLILFCRLLSLLIFEPEDRHIMEGIEMLKSLELLSLRRNRNILITKNNLLTIEKNQNLVRKRCI